MYVPWQASRFVPGESKEFGGGVLTSELRNVPNEMHQVDRNLALIEYLGFKASSRELRLQLPVASAIDTRQPVGATQSTGHVLLERAGLDSSRPFIILHPGASAEARRYPAVKFGKVAADLTARGHQVLITGVGSERETVEEVILDLPDYGTFPGGSEGQGRSVVAPLDLSILEFAEIVAGAACVICNNSLPLHLADAAGTPVVVLYSGTDLESQWRPRRSPHVLLRRPTPCHPCYLFRCPIELPCLDVEPEHVARAATDLLETCTASSSHVAKHPLHSQGRGASPPESFAHSLGSSRIV